MTEKTLIKLDWKDIKKHFPKAMRSGILVNTDKPHIIIPTTTQHTLYSILFLCVNEWKASNVKVAHNEVGFLNFEFIWDGNYQIEVELYPNDSNE